MVELSGVRIQMIAGFGGIQRVTEGKGGWGGVRGSREEESEGNGPKAALSTKGQPVTSRWLWLHNLFLFFH